MALIDLPPEFEAFAQAAVSAVRRAYDVNADRHDPLIGDDQVVFGIAVYRNSWYLLEQEVEALEGWQSARPLGSLVITGAGVRVHVYRYGQTADVDLDSFRLDDARASITQRLIAETNSEQLSLPILEEWAGPTESIAPELPELVIVHAGNPEDGCCGIWVGAPIAGGEITSSPWRWIETLWLPESAGWTEAPSEQGLPPMPRHDELPEPVVPLSPVVAEDAEDL